MDDPIARIIIMQGPSAHSEYVLTQARTIIGRGHTNDIVIADAEVSRQHAQIVHQGDTYTIEDLGSTNGTFVNDEPAVGITALNDGDQIGLGAVVKIIFSYPRSAGDSPAYPAFSGVTPAEPLPEEQAAFTDFPRPASDRRRWLLGCGCGLLLSICLCAAALFFLDAYDQGRLLYCGPLEPIFHTLLDPFGFSPACAVP